MTCWFRFVLFSWFCGAIPPAAAEVQDESLFGQSLSISPGHISMDSSVKYDYDIVYVRARRAGDQVDKRYYTDFSQPVTMEPGADLMLLHPDGNEELLVAGGRGSVTVSVKDRQGNESRIVRTLSVMEMAKLNPSGRSRIAGSEG